MIRPGILFGGSSENRYHGRIAKMTEGECSPTPHKLVVVAGKKARDQWCSSTNIQSAKGIDGIHAHEPFRVVEESKGQRFCSLRSDFRHAVKGTGTARTVRLMS
jgi:hypothetical protein